MQDAMNEAQCAAVMVTLASLEKSLRQALFWLEGGTTEGILFRTSLHVSRERRAAAMAHISAALDTIGRLAQRFKLPPAQEPLEAKIVAAMSLGWANLTDVASDKLRRYGEVARELEERFLPQAEIVTVPVRLLKETMDEIQSLLNSEGLDLEQGLRTMLCRGFGYTKGKLHLESAGERTERIAERLATLEPMYAVLKFEAYGLIQDNRALALRETSLRSSLDLSFKTIEALRQENKRLQDQLELLRGEPAQHRPTDLGQQTAGPRGRKPVPTIVRAAQRCRERIARACRPLGHAR